MRILVFQHLSIEHPGVFRDLWREGGHQWVAVQLDAGEPIPKLDPFDLLVVMGGPMDVWEEDFHPWLVPEKAAIKDWVCDLQRPFLGICLGHQLLADALGGEVRLMAKPEVGFGPVALTQAGFSDPLMSSLSPQFNALHWHGAEVVRLPNAAVALAETPSCAVQAMRCGERAYGVQCHIEITTATVAEWAVIPQYRASLEANLGADGVAQLSDAVESHIVGITTSAQRIHEAVMSLVNI